MAGLSINPVVMLGWAITPAFFWAGLAAASIPIIIHLLNRRRFKVVRWAAMDYLLQAMRKNRRRLKFEQILLLATRCALLALLGLALARPLGCADSSIAALAGQKSGLHVFIIDNSYSMAYQADRTDAPAHLDQAKILAKQQIDRLNAGSEAVAIISAARLQRPQPGNQKPADAAAIDEGLVILRPSFDLDAAKAAIDRIEQSYGATDLPGAMQTALELAREEQRQPQKFLYILTDFTRSAWEGPPSELLRRTARQAADVFRAPIRINNLAREGQWNYAVLDVRPDGGLVKSNLDTVFLADVKGYGAGPETVVQWNWDDKLLPDSSRFRPDVSGDYQRLAKSDIREGGAHVLSVSLVHDEKLKLDNTRWRVVEVASAMPILVVEGERGTGSLSGSGTSLAYALAPRREVGSDGAVQSSTYVVPEVISDLELGNKVLNDYRAVVLTNVGSIGEQQADQIQRYVQGGGTLMLFMGEQVVPDVYNSILVPRKLLPGKLVARKNLSSGQKFTFDFNPSSPVLHPLLTEFRNQERSGLDTAEIQAYYQVELDPELRADVVLKYLAGESQTSDPAITRHNLGKGFVVTVTTTANSDWNSLPPKPAYIPLMHELLSGSVDLGERWMNLAVGEPVQVPPSLKITSTPVLTDSARKQIGMEAVSQPNGQTVYRSEPLAKPGLYQLSLGDRIIPIAVNVPADEADVRVLPDDAVRKLLGDIEVQILGDEVPASALARDDGRDLGWTLMLLVLALAGIECFLAMHFGHYRRARGSRPAPEVAVPAASG